MIDDRDPWQEEIEAEATAKAAAERERPEKKNWNGHASPSSAEWPEPADLLGQTIEAAAPFPLDFLPGVLRGFARDVADRMQCPVDLIGIPLIIEAATLIGKGFRLAPKAADDWSERPCLWGGVVCGSATMKSPAFEKALAPIRNFQSEFWEEHNAASEDHAVKVERAKDVEQQWREAATRARKNGEPMPEKPEAGKAPEAPKRRRLLTGDTTQEALVDLIEQNPRGMLLFRDELSAWFRGFNQYRPGSDRQFFLECYSGGSFMKDRRGSGSVMVDDLYLSICGGIQPDIVAKVLAGGDLDGMTARFSLLVWPDLAGEFRYVDRPPDHHAQRETEQVLRCLLKLDPERFFGPAGAAARHRRVLRFDEAGQEIFKLWYTKKQVVLRSGGYEGGMQAHVGKYPGIFARIAIVHHLLRMSKTRRPVPC